MAHTANPAPAAMAPGAFAVSGNPAQPDQPAQGVCFSVQELDALELLLLHASSVAGLIRQNEDESSLNLEYIIGSAWLIQEQMDRASALIEGVMARSGTRKVLHHD